jgi:hypothetical protein
MADADGQGGVDDEVLVDGLQTEHGAEQQQRSAGGPGLRAARGGIRDGVLGDGAVVAAEGLGQAAVEELGGVEDAGGDAGGFVLVAVAAQPPGDERVVERPDGADVVADGVVAFLALGQGADAPAGVEAGSEQVLDDVVGAAAFDDAGPEQVADVGGQGVDLAAVGVEGERVVLAVLDPEVAVEAAFEVGGLLVEGVGEGGVVPDGAGQAGGAFLGVVGVALQFAGGAGEAGQAAVGVGDGVPGVLPALVLQAGVGVAGLVPDVAVAAQVGVLIDPVEGGAGLEFQVADEFGVAAPALVLVEQDEEQRGAVGGAVVGGVGPLLEGGELAVPHLVEDLAGVFVAEVVDTAALAGAEFGQCRGGQRRRVGQGLQTGEDAVAAEHGHEPGQARGGQGAFAGGHGREAQGGQVGEAAPVRVLERLPVAFEFRRSGDPLVEVLLHVLAGVPGLGAGGDALVGGPAPQ